MPLDSQGSYHRVRAHPHNAPIHHHSSHSPALTRTQPQENSIGPSTSSPAGHRPAVLWSERGSRDVRCQVRRQFLVHPHLEQRALRG
ncbi:hypothetical protein ACWDAZ_39650, partial [Streptomyces sp. NPDC001215]